MGAGAGFNALAAAGAQAGLDKIQRKRDAADEERRGKAEPLLADTKNLQAEISSYKDGNGNIIPQYQAQHDKAVDALTKTQQAWDELYHPVKAPGAVAQDMHWIIDKFKNITAPKGKTPPAPAAPPQPGTMTLPTMPPAPFTTPDMPAYQQVTPTLDLDANLHTHPGSTTTQIPGNPSTTQPGMVAPAAPPLLVTQSFADNPAPGMVAKGNLDLSKRPNVDNGDGTHSSTFSMSFGTDKGEVLVPGVGDGKTYPERQLRVLYTLPDGSQKWAVPGNQPHNWIAPERPTPQNNEALNQYQKTGRNFGTFEDEKAADAYGKALHEDQEKYGKNGVTAHPVSPSGNITLPTPPSPKVTQSPAPSWGQAQVLKQRAAAMQKAQQEAALLVSGAPLSPQQQAMSKFRTDDLVHQAQIESTLKTAEKLGLSETAMDELKQQLVGLKNVTPKPLTGAAGQPYKGPDGLYRQAVTNPDGTVGFRMMPADWKPNTKAVRGTLVNVKGIGFVQTWVDPYNPSKVVGYQKVTPGRQYAGTTSTSSSTDSFGLTTSSSRSTMPTTSAPVDMDLSGVQELPESYNGEDVPQTQSPFPSGQPPAATPSGLPNKSPAPTSAPPKSVSKPTTGTAPPQTPAQVRNNVPAPPQASGAPLSLDATGHIPANAPYNPGLIEAANQLFDGQSMDKLTLPQKDRPAAEALARKYGWGGQGLFNPQQKMQIKIAGTFLNRAMKNPSLDVLNSWESRQKLIAYINNAEGHAGWTDAAIARNTNLNPKEAEFLRMFRQLTGTISGLASLTRPGRPTEAGIKRMIAELPNPNESHSADDGRKRIKRLVDEITIAQQKGNADTLFDESQSGDENPTGSLSLDDFAKKHNIPPVKR